IVILRAGGIDRRGEHIRPHHHARPAARRRVVDAAVLVGRVRADVVDIESPDVLLEGPPGQAQAERTGKHLGKECEDGRTEAHASSSLWSRSPGGGSITTRLFARSTSGTTRLVNGTNSVS